MRYCREQTRPKRMVTFACDPPDASLAALLPVFDQGMVAIVKEGDEFLGIITRIDLVNYLRQRMK